MTAKAGWEMLPFGTPNGDVSENTHKLELRLVEIELSELFHQLDPMESSFKSRISNDGQLSFLEGRAEYQLVYLYF